MPDLSGPTWQAAYLLAGLVLGMVSERAWAWWQVYQRRLRWRRLERARRKAQKDG